MNYGALGRMLRDREKDILLYPGPYRSYVPGFHEAFKEFYRGATQ